MGRSKRVLRTLSLVLLLTFLVRETAFAEGLAPLLKDGLEPKPSLSLRFPASVAQIEDAYKAPHVIASEAKQSMPDQIASSTSSPRNDQRKTIYLLQDAHTNESGQYNLAKTLSIILHEEKDLKYVFTEAGVGDNSLSFLREKSPLNAREAVARSYIKKGYLHGAEYLDLTSEHDFVLWGVEDLGLYAKALEDYRQVAKERGRFELYLKKIEATVETLKGRLFNPALATFARERKEYREEKLPLTSYFSALMRECRLQNIPLSNFPHLSLLKDLKDREEALDFQKANGEHAKAVASLSDEARTELKELSVTDNKAGKVLQGRKDVQAYFFALEEKLGDKGRAYPELSKYFDYLKTSLGLEAKQVLKEIDALERGILGRLFLTEEEKTLLACDDSLFYQRKIFRFTLTPEDYAAYKEKMAELPIESLTGFLNKQIMDLGAYYERSLFLEESYEKVLGRAESFYETTRDRDEQFLKASLEKLEKEDASKAVLITGGFHTANLKSLLKAKGISYVSVTPQVWQETNLKKYESVLLGQDLKALRPAGAPAAASGIAVLAARTDRAWGDRLVREISGAAEGAGARLADKPKRTDAPQDAEEERPIAAILAVAAIALGLIGAFFAADYFIHHPPDSVLQFMQYIEDEIKRSAGIPGPSGARLAAYQHEEQALDSAADAAAAYFASLPEVRRPRFLAELGGSDAELLLGVYQKLKGVLSEEELTNLHFVLADGDSQGRASAFEALMKAGVPRKNIIRMPLDISKPETFQYELEKRLRYNKLRFMTDDGFYMTSMEIHRRALRQPFHKPWIERIEKEEARHMKSKHRWTDTEGQELSTAWMQRNLIEFLSGWAGVSAKHGMLVVEHHTPEKAAPGEGHAIEFPVFQDAALRANARVLSQTKFPTSAPDREATDSATLFKFMSVPSIASHIKETYDRYISNVYAINDRAGQYFIERNNAGIEEDQSELVILFSKYLDEVRTWIRSELGERLHDMTFWDRLEAYFLYRSVNHEYDRGLAKKFFDALKGRVYAELPGHAFLEFGDDGIEAPVPVRAQSQVPYRILRRQGSTEAMVRELFDGLPFRSQISQENFEKAVAQTVRRFEERFDKEPMKSALEEGHIEVLSSHPFYRNKGVYIMGLLKSANGKAVAPIVLALNNLEANGGIQLHAVLTDFSIVNHLFHSSRTNFRVPGLQGHYREILPFLWQVIPDRDLAVVYSSIGFLYPAKSRFLNRLHDFMKPNMEFEKTEGREGTLMLVMRLSGFPFVFKLIREKALEQEGAPPKGLGNPHTLVTHTYREADRRNRVGRKLGAMKFYKIAFPARNFSDEILNDFRTQFKDHVRFVKEPKTGEEMVLIKDLYVQSAVVPLDVLMRDPSTTKQEEFVLMKDFVQALVDLAQAGIFQSDSKPQNFGRTQDGRVVSFDNDDMLPVEELGYIRMDSDVRQSVMSPASKEATMQDRYRDPDYILENKAYNRFRVKHSDLVVVTDYNVFNHIADRLYAFLGEPELERGEVIALIEYFKNTLENPDFWEEIKRGLITRHDIPQFFPYPVSEWAEPPANGFSSSGMPASRLIDVDAHGRFETAGLPVILLVDHDPNMRRYYVQDILTQLEGRSLRDFQVVQVEQFGDALLAMETAKKAGVPLYLISSAFIADPRKDGVSWEASGAALHRAALEAGYPAVFISGTKPDYVEEANFVRRTGNGFAPPSERIPPQTLLAAIHNLLQTPSGARLAEQDEPSVSSSAFTVPPVVLQALRAQLNMVRMQESVLRFWFGSLPGFEVLYRESLLHDYRALLELMLVSDHVVTTDLFEELAEEASSSGARLATRDRTKTAVLFPPASNPMSDPGRDLYDKYDYVRDLYARVNAAAAPFMEETELSFDVQKTGTVIGKHVASLAYEMALWEVYKREVLKGGSPDSVMGISRGSIAAFYASGAIDLPLAVELIIKNMQFLEAASKDTGHRTMGVVWMAEAALLPILEAHKGVITIRITDRQFIISAAAADLEAIKSEIEAASPRGRFVPSVVTVASHDPNLVFVNGRDGKMTDKAEAFETYLMESVASRMEIPEIPLYSSVTGRRLMTQQDLIEEAMRFPHEPIQLSTTLPMYQKERNVSDFVMLGGLDFIIPGQRKSGLLQNETTSTAIFSDADILSLAWEMAIQPYIDGVHVDGEDGGVIIAIGREEDLEGVMKAQRNSASSKAIYQSEKTYLDLIKNKQLLVARAKVSKDGVAAPSEKVIGSVAFFVTDRSTVRAHSNALDPANHDPSGDTMYDPWIAVGGFGRAGGVRISDALLDHSHQIAERAGKALMAFSRPGDARKYFSKEDKGSLEGMREGSDKGAYEAFRGKLVVRHFLLMRPRGQRSQAPSAEPFMEWVSENYDNSELDRKVSQVVFADPDDKARWNPAKDKAFVGLLGLLVRKYLDEHSEEEILPVDPALGGLHSRRGATMADIFVGDTEGRPDDTDALGANVIMSYEKIEDIDSRIVDLMKQNGYPSSNAGARMAENELLRSARAFTPTADSVADDIEQFAVELRGLGIRNGSKIAESLERIAGGVRVGQPGMREELIDQATTLFLEGREWYSAELTGMAQSIPRIDPSSIRGARLARKNLAQDEVRPDPREKIYALFKEAVTQDRNEASTKDFLERFQIQTALAHADEFKGPEDEKILTIRLDARTLKRTGLRFDRKTGRLTVTDKESNETAVLDVREVRKTPQGLEGKISLADAKLLEDQAHAAVVRELGALTELHTEKKVLILESLERIGQPGVRPALAVFAAGALRHVRERKDANVRFGVEGMDVGILRGHLTKLENDNRLSPGTLTSLFDLNGFEAQETVYITSPGSPAAGQRNLVVKQNASSDITLAVVSGRLEETEIAARPEFVSAIKTRLDRSVRFDINVFLKVFKGLEENVDIQELYALLPVVQLIDWQLGARLAALQLRTTGSAA